MTKRRVLGVVVAVIGLATAIVVHERGDEVATATAIAPPPAQPVQPEAPKPRKTLSAERLRALSPKVFITPEGGRVLLGPRKDEHGKVHARVPELEEALDAEGVDEARSTELSSKLREALPEGARVSALDVACSDSLCRAKLVKPVQTEALWDEVNVAIQELTPGEKIFLTETEADVSTGYVYFSGDEGVLPLARLEREDEDEGT